MHICFLDIDGTLVSTGGAGQAAFAVTLAKDFGITNVTTSGVPFAGRSDRAIALDLFALYGIEPTPDVWNQFHIGYIKRLEEVLPTYKGRVLPGVVALLEQLAARGDVALGLLTGNVHEAARRKLQYYKLWDWFPFGGFGDEHTDRCDIAAAALAAGRTYLNGNSSATHGQLVVIGDTPNDILCARSIGARCVAVPTGNTSVDTLRGAQPDVLVDTLEDVAAVMALLDE
ncbi:MAG TPA: HAD hydrolase-like protein [Lacipirellulaceae bacterium]|jgi:phosphoglycolate phosphatase-like HAD superfamily hydrolase